jgi:cellulose synthase/poly-beta-1,6-N-acetylglucosamine synthase-like glycosyltransferase
MGPALLVTGIVACVIALAYAGLILFFFFGWKKLQRQGIPGRTEAGMKVSVIIAARNEERNIGPLLDSLASQDYPRDLTEVIVVDDGSEEGTASRAEDFILKHGLTQWKVLKRKGDDGKGSKKDAITLGVKAAQGEIILVTDADCSLSPGWITSLISRFGDEQTIMVAGPVAIQGAEGLEGKFQTLEFLGLVASGAGAVGAGQPFLCNGANLAYRKAAFLEVDGYRGNERFRSGDDVFLLHKLKAAYGNRAIAFAFDRKALVTTSPTGSFGAFLRQRARWASKSPGYRDALSAFTALSVFLMAILMVCCFVAGFFDPLYFLVLIGLIIFKSLSDIPLMLGITKFTGDQRLIKWMPLFEAAYPFYVLLAASLSLFRRKRW